MEPQEGKKTNWSITTIIVIIIIVFGVFFFIMNSDKANDGKMNTDTESEDVILSNEEKAKVVEKLLQSKANTYSTEEKIKKIEDLNQDQNQEESSTLQEKLDILNSLE